MNLIAVRYSWSWRASLSPPHHFVGCDPVTRDEEEDSHALCMTRSNSCKTASGRCVCTFTVQTRFLQL